MTDGTIPRYCPDTAFAYTKSIIYAFCVYANVSDVISVRVKKELKKKAEELGINIKEVVEKALDEAIKEKEKERLRETALKIKELMKDVNEEEWITVIRENRNER